MSPDKIVSPLVFDASVTINFLGSGIAGDLLRVLGRTAYMAERTYEEIKRHPLKGRDHLTEMQDLRKDGLLQIETLDSSATQIFYDLIASGDISGGLDDGEAAAIALATSMGDDAVSVLDDRKARSLLTRRWPARRALYTVDLLSEDAIARSIERATLAQAVHSALISARMRVPHHQRDWVLALIGPERASGCSSLGMRTASSAEAGVL